MSIDTVRGQAAAAGLLTIVDGQLKVTGPRRTLTPELRQAIADHKPALIAALTRFHQLDPAIIASEAGQRSLDEIERRLMRMKAGSAQPAATALDRQVARDWTAIHRTKLAGERAA